MKREYIAFISYRHDPLDAVVAGALHTIIEQYRIPAALVKTGNNRLGLIFRDQEELSASSDLSADIRNALDRSQFLIVVCSPEAAASPWVNREIDYFLKNHDRQKILTVLTSGEPQEAFPWALTHIIDEQGQTVQEVEPLAVDVRADNRRTTLRYLRKRALKLIAALISCSYDELVMREQRRQRKRALAAFFTVFVVTLCFCGLLLFKNHEIDQKNLELEEANRILEENFVQLKQQTAAIQLRESELLVVDAEEALAQGDRAAAIRSAIKALPRAGELERPYYAPAEHTLLSALDLFGDQYDGKFLINTTLEQTTPIDDIQISEGGRILTTIDTYGTINGFDTSNGALLWSSRIRQAGPASDLLGVKLCFSAPINGVIGCYRETLAAYSVDGGDLLWETDAPGIESTDIFLSKDQRRLAYLASALKFSFDKSEQVQTYSLVVLSAETGEELNRISLQENKEKIFHIDVPTFSLGLHGGTFSEDGNRFAGCYYKPEDGAYTVYYYVADLTDNSWDVVYSCFLENMSAYSDCVLSLEFTDSDRSLLVMRSDDSYYMDVTAEKIELQSRSLLWETTLPLEELRLSKTEEFHSLSNSEYVFISCADQLYVLNAQNGAYIEEISMKSSIIALERIDNSLAAGCAFDSGSSGVAQIFNEDGEDTLGVILRTVADIPADTRMVDFWGDAFFSTDFSEIRETDSFAVVMQEENDHTLILRSVRSTKDISQPETVSCSANGYGLYGGKAVLCPNYSIVIGPFSQGEESGYIVLDAASLEQKGDMIPYNSYITDNVYFLSDASGYIKLGSSELSLYQMATRTKSTLSENESVELFQSDVFTLVDSKYLFAAAPLLADGRLLTVQCGAGMLRLWLDGEEQESVPLPEGLRWSVTEHGTYKRVLQAGGSGYILISHFSSEDSLTMSGFAAYDTLNGTWTQFADQASGSADRIFCMGETTPIFCVVDEDETVRVYDMTTGRVVQALPLPLPVRSVGQIKLLLDDTALMVSTKDGQIYIYSVATGEMLFHEQSEAKTVESISAYVDEEGQRLYLVIDGALLGYLIDLNSWTKLTDIHNMIGYLPQSNRVLRYTYVGGWNFNKELTACRIPRTDELVELGTRLFS